MSPTFDGAERAQGNVSTRDSPASPHKRRGPQERGRLQGRVALTLGPVPTIRRCRRQAGDFHKQPAGRSRSARPHDLGATARATLGTLESSPHNTRICPRARGGPPRQKWLRGVACRTACPPSARPPTRGSARPIETMMELDGCRDKRSMYTIARPIGASQSNCS